MSLPHPNFPKSRCSSEVAGPQMRRTHSDVELPPDLERGIFETTAVLYPKAIPRLLRLLRVARCVLAWKVIIAKSLFTAHVLSRIEPLLYTSIRISVFDSIRPLAANMLRLIPTKSADFFPSAVKHMKLISYDPEAKFDVKSINAWSNAELKTALAACTGVKYLLLLDLASPPILPMIANMRLMRITMIAMHSHLDFTQPVFQNVNHLIIGASESPTIQNIPFHADWQQWPVIFRLPALTHLGLARSTSYTPSSPLYRAS
ncbi:hypothetical protein B0H17DRAFT_123132 [Mycena rosella]|uniref:Uncharacterized protein n=1 Tax=Mycena rosella TaxID=1033263 RepID=A0AAD7D3H4_MYCRO|nr:hypothetical protein B0H17DRAFT_123132 [Mycena rosella]